jgi:hypothetical protein
MNIYDLLPSECDDDNVNYIEQDILWEQSPFVKIVFSHKFLVH